MSHEGPISSPEGRGEEQETRHRILTAARELMAMRGYKGATTRAIAEMAGVNEVTVFRHFGNKEGILSAIVQEMTAIRPLLQETLEAEYPTLREMLIQYGKTFVQKLNDEKELMMISMLEALNRPELGCAFTGLPMMVEEELVKKLTEYQERGLIRQADYVVLAHMFVASYITAFIVLYRMKDQCFPITEEQMHEQVADILVMSLENQ
ncbi:TetR/AcrR family transcriptional regulator [Brevibacillus dissolubilis]|uniref:TetR/AcrR family transcriptional regulator n=1 Tax=Brevibacillus dissolubilis TaxID=1844116 RepID=UPI001117300A|nr:TetR/AcrR family transcriptional regulator [Brevibacillus dissolubilis]